MPKIRADVYGVVGSRRRDSYDDYSQLESLLDSLLTERDKLVSGGCPKGGDRMAEEYARKRGRTITIHYPDWNGPAKKAAGFVRNTKIADDCTILIALPAQDRTGGTEDTIRKCEKLGKKIILI